MSVAKPVNQLVAFFALAFALTWGIWFPMAIAFPSIKILHLLGALGPMVAALIMAVVADRKEGLKEILKSAMRWRVPLKWYGIAVLVPFAFLVIAITIERFLNFPMPKFADLLQTTEFGSLGLLYWVASIVFYGFGEEVGWRGFALPKLVAAGLDPAKSSAIFSLFWALWHLPLFFYGALLGSMSPLMIVGWYLSLLLSSYLITWIWQSSGRSIFIVALFHGVVDIVMTSRAAIGPPVIIMNALLLLWGFVIVKTTAPDLGRQSTPTH